MSADTFAPALYPRLDGVDVSAERARARLQGYAEGHAEGFRAGSAKAAALQHEAERQEMLRVASAAADMEAALAALQAAVHSLGDRESELVAAGHEQVLRLAVDLAQLIIMGDLSDAGASAATAARRALAETEAREIREVRLHPDDWHTLQSSPQNLIGLALVADDSLDRGDAITVLEHGYIDARIASAFERAHRAAGEAQR